MRNRFFPTYDQGDERIVEETLMNINGIQYKISQTRNQIEIETLHIKLVGYLGLLHSLKIKYEDQLYEDQQTLKYYENLDRNVYVLYSLEHSIEKSKCILEKIRETNEF